MNVTTTTAIAADNEPAETCTPVKSLVPLEGSETVKELLDKLAYLKKVISKDVPIPILENVLFDKGVMYASNFQSSAAHKTSIKGTFVMPVEPAMKFLSKVSDKKQSVSISYEESTYAIVLSVGQSQFKVSGDNPGDFVRINIPREQIGTITRSDLDKITHAFKYTSTDVHRVPMNGVLVENDRVVATDGFRLSIQKFEKELGITCSFILPPSARKVLPALGDCQIKIADQQVLQPERVQEPDESTASYPQVEGNVSFVCGEKAYFGKLINEFFPDYKRILPKHFSHSIYINKDRFQEAIELALIAANRTLPKVRLKLLDAERLQVQAEDADFNNEYTCVIPVARLTGGPRYQKEKHTFDEQTGEILKTETVDDGAVEIGFNGKFLLDFIKETKEENTLMQLQAASKAALLNGECMLMPLMLNS